MKNRRTTAALLSLLLAASMSAGAFAAEDAAIADETAAVVEETAAEDAAAEATVEEAVEETAEAVPAGAYVLMNIPYTDFYAAEGIDGEVDAVSSATKNKPRTGTLAGGSYHVNADGTDISGVIYPVYVADLSALAGYTEITDAASVTITVTNRGQETTTEYAGSEALFEAPDYAYYVLTETLACYKTLNADGTFSAASGSVTEVEGAEAAVIYNARHADIEISLTLPSGVVQGDSVSAVVLTDSEGKTYALRHIANIWRGTEIGWDYDEFDLLGKTLTNIRYYTQNGVFDYPVSLTLKQPLHDTLAAKFISAKTIALTGICPKSTGLTATVTKTVGTGREAVTTTYAQNVPVTAGGIVQTTLRCDEPGTYTVTVNCNEYIPAVAAAAKLFIGNGPGMMPGVGMFNPTVVK